MIMVFDFKEREWLKLQTNGLYSLHGIANVIRV